MSRKRAKTREAKKAANPEKYLTMAEIEARRRQEKAQRTAADYTRLVELWDADWMGWKGGHPPLICVQAHSGEKAEWLGLVQMMDLSDRTMWVRDVEFMGDPPNEGEVREYGPGKYVLYSKRTVDMADDFFLPGD